MLSIGSKVRDLTIESMVGETPRLTFYRASDPTGPRLVAEVRGRVLDPSELQRRIEHWSDWSESARLGLPTALVRSGEATLLVSVLQDSGPWRTAGISIAPELRLAWLGRAVDAVSALHSHRIAHGELGPQSLRLTSGGGVVLLMPGVADLLEPATDLLEPATGGEAWTEPEIASGALPTMPSDVFALGIFAAELAGRKVAPGSRRALRAIAAGRQPWPQFEPAASGWPTEVTAVMNGALLSRADRPSNAVVLRAVLRSQASQTPVEHTSPSIPIATGSAEAKPVKKARRRRRIRPSELTGVVALFAVVALGLWVTNRPYRPSCSADADCASGLTCDGALCGAEGMVYLPAAAFEIGAMDYSPSEYTEPYRAKLTYGFYIDALEVTQSQFREATGTSPAWSSACGDDCPVESVNWFEAATYANRRSQAAGLERCYRLVDCTGDFGTGCPELVPGGEHHQCMGSFRCATAEFVGLQCEGYRLPTEVEWEYAARGGTTDASYAGAIIPAGGPGSEESLARLATIARTAENSAVTFDNAWPCSLIDGMTNGVSCGPGLVGSLQPNAYGLHDMLGNVGEWTHDTPEIDPAQMSGWRCFGRSTIRSTGESSCRRSRVVDRTHYEPSGDLRMLRGGAWFHSAPGVRVPERSWLRTEARFVDVGFRLVRAAVPPG